MRPGRAGMKEHLARPGLQALAGPEPLPGKRRPEQPGQWIPQQLLRKDLHCGIITPAESWGKIRKIALAQSLPSGTGQGQPVDLQIAH